MTTTETQALIGKRTIFIMQSLAALVTIKNVRSVFGRTDYLVQDCQGHECWVRASSCQPVANPSPTPMTDPC